MKHKTKIVFGGKRWWILPIGICFILIAIKACGPRPNDSTASKPNIVLIVADDLGYGDLGCYGATKIATPVLDQLANEGMAFNNAYVTSSLCTPSRYSIMTGRYPWRTRLKFGVLKYFERPLIESNETTIASMLKSEGYHTAMVGKWHLGLDWQVNDKAPENPEENVFNSWGENLTEFIDFTKPVGNGPTHRGFDYFYGMAGSNNMQPYVLIENDSVLQVPSVEQKAYDHYIPALRAPNWDIQNINANLTNKAVEVINNHFKDQDDKPLFLYFPTSAIHRPCLPTFTKGKSLAGLRGDIVEELDWTVNQIIEALKSNGAYENTLLIFTSDNGPRPGDPALWMDAYADGDYEDFHQDYFDDYQPEFVDPNGNKIWKAGWYTYGHKAAGDYIGFKSDSWDGGLRVPLIVHWPGHVEAGVRNNNAVCTSDLLATIADVVGYSLSSNEGQDSYSFISNIRDVKAPQVRESLILAGGSSGAMIAIHDNWKFIEAADSGRWPETYYPNGPSKFDWQLYHISEDQSEQHNLFNEKPDKVTELKELISRVQSQTKTEGRKVTAQKPTP